MTTIHPIRSEADYEATLERIGALMGASAGSPAFDELEVLTTLVEVYEDKHFPIDFPTPIQAIEFRMEQAGLTQADLAKYIGSRSKVSEVLSGKRNLTLNMIRALNRHLGIPTQVLVGDGTVHKTDDPEIQWERFPIAEMTKRGWFSKFGETLDSAENLIGALIDCAGGRHAVPQAFYRKNNAARRNASMDPYALQAWCLHVLASARENPPTAKYDEKTIDESFLRFLATLSRLPNGPQRAVEALQQQGVAVIYARHLPKTHLDGAAMRTKEGIPVIGLTLRYDRLDNFWFCLLHEVAHIWKHVSKENSFYVDDLSLTKSDHDEDWSIEDEADQLAQNSLIPCEAWRSSGFPKMASPSRIMAFAQSINVHPAIVAGRVRKETGNYRLLSQFVGTNEVRKYFEEAS